MFRTTLLMSGVLAFLNVAAACACDGPNCGAPARVKPRDIMQFMREQAASTRGVSLRALPKEARPHVASRRDTGLRHSQISVPARVNPVRATSGLRASTYAMPKRASSHSRLVDAPPHAVVRTEAASFAAHGPSVQVVPADELNSVDLATPAFAAVPPEVGQTARQVVANAFDEIDRFHEGSLTIDDLRSASERAQVEQSPSWLQRILSTLAGTLTAFGTD